MTSPAAGGDRPPLARGARPAAAIAAAGSLLLAALAVGCASAPPPPPALYLDRTLDPFLVDPAPLSVGATAAQVSELHRRLLAAADAMAIERAATELVATAPNDAGARLLLAEARLVRGQAAPALAAIAEIPASSSRAPEVALVAGRAAELTGDLPAAVSWYRLAGGELAGERIRELEPRAAEILGNRGRDLLARGRLDEAERALGELEQWRPTDLATLELAREVAVARNDPRRELSALRALSPARPDAVELQLRRGALEVQIGDSRVGLELLTALAAKRPGDARVADELERAKLFFRLANAPEPVRLAVSRTQLSRADFARLLYWLVPDVRSARGGAPKIASDILDHPAREEIVRVVNLGLLPVDESRHLFEPDRSVRRAEALRAILIDPSIGGWRQCASRAGGDVCAAAVACGLLTEAGDCLPSAPLSGLEAADWIRRVPAAGGGR